MRPIAHGTGGEKMGPIAHGTGGEEMSTRHDVTRILRRWSAGDERALDHLLPMLYDQLKEIARWRLRSERPDHTLNPTALVHEAYLKLVDVNQITWNDRSHFLAMASRTMRRVLVDYAVARKAQKRGGGAARVELDEGRVLSDEQAETVLDLHDALERLEVQHARQCRALELKYFGGMTLEEVGQALGISPATVMRDIRFGEAWLAREFDRKNTGRPPTT